MPHCTGALWIFFFKIVLNIFLFPIFVSTCVFDSMSMQVRGQLVEVSFLSTLGVSDWAEAWQQAPIIH